MKLLFDWDFFVYQMSWLCQTRPKDEFGHITDRESWDLKPLPYAYVALHAIVKSALQTYDTKDYTGILSHTDDTNNFRKMLYPMYKAQRRVKDRPLYYHDIRDHILERYPCIVASETVEADDALGIMQCSSKNTAIVSADKDMRMIPGNLYIPAQKEKLTVSDPGHLSLIKKEKGGKYIKGYGFKWFCAQMLLGDTADNIPQLKKNFADVSVYEYLKEYATIGAMWEAVIKAYDAEGKTMDDVLLQAKLLWIFREPGQVFQESIVVDLIREQQRRAV